MFFSDFPPFPRGGIFTLMLFCIAVIVLWGSVLRVHGSTVYVTMRCVFRQRENTSNICCDYIQYIQCPDKSPPLEQKSTQKKYSEVTIEKCYKGQNLLSSFLSLQTRKSVINMLCKNELFPFCKNQQSQ
jgi:hypothetical protein